MDILSSFLHILGYIVPTGVVYFLMRQFVNGHMATEQMKIRLSQDTEDRAIKMQAYERLILLCERMNIMSLLMRLNTPEMDSAHLKNAMLISIQKEYEHNLTQQIYISSQLWEMIGLLKNNVLSGVTQCYEQYGSDKSIFKEQLMKIGPAIDHSMAKKVREGIRKEVELYLR